MSEENLQEEVKAQFFATVFDGKIAGVCEAIPPHVLESNQIALTREEYDFMKCINGNLSKAYKLIIRLRDKIKANQQGNSS